MRLIFQESNRQILDTQHVVYNFNCESAWIECVLCLVNNVCYVVWDAGKEENLRPFNNTRQLSIIDCYWAASLRDVKNLSGWRGDFRISKFSFGVLIFIYQLVKIKTSYSWNFVVRCQRHKCDLGEYADINILLCTCVDENGVVCQPISEA